MPVPRIDWQGPKLFFHDADGGMWRVYDCALVEQRARAVPHGDPKAVRREFVGSDGSRRVCHLERGISRAISPTVLAQQLRAAEGGGAPALGAAVRADVAEGAPSRAD